MPIKNDREYRTVQPFKPAEGEEYTVSGYASTFKPYVLFENADGSEKYIEEIDRNAFDTADMTDVIMQYDHAGRVYARQSNGSLELTVDDNGLKVRADLSRSAGARDLYEDIKAELITQMSFAFIVAEDEYSYNEARGEYRRYIKRIKKVFDVSAVSIPANPTTEIGIDARAGFEGYIEARRLEEAKRDLHIRKIRLMTEV